MDASSIAPGPSDCKVCHALDTLPEPLAGILDRGLAATTHHHSAIARWLTAHDHPTSRKSVERHRHGKCALGLDYRKVAA